MGLRERGRSAYRLASEKLRARRKGRAERRGVKVGSGFGGDDRNVVAQENARDRERALDHVLGRWLVATVVLVMRGVVVMTCMDRLDLLRGRNAGAKDDRQPRGIRRQHEARGHEHARDEQRQQPERPAMEMRTLHAERKYTRLRGMNPWLLWAMVAEPRRTYRFTRTTVHEGMFPTGPRSRDLSLITQLRDLRHIWTLAALVDSTT